MSGFGTIKPGGGEAVQLTFPSNFSREYKKMRLQARYAPDGIKPVVHKPFVGDDEMAQLQRERRADAHRMVMAGVHATNIAEKRANMSHAGYYGMPDPVLSQRRVGSLYGVGGGFNSAIMKQELVGGVIGSPEGRAWVKEALRRRKAELDALDANAFGMPLSRAVSTGEPPMEFTDLARLELVSFLDQLYAMLQENNIQFAPEAFRRFFRLFIRFCTSANKEEMDDVKERLDEIQEIILAQLGSRMEEAERDIESYRGEGYLNFLGSAILGAIKYMNEMYAGLNMSAEERKALSKAALRSSGLAKLNKYADRYELGRLIPGPGELRYDEDDMAFLDELYAPGSEGSESTPQPRAPFAGRPSYPPLPASVASMGSTQYSLPSSRNSMGSTQYSFSTDSLASGSSGSTLPPPPPRGHGTARFDRPGLSAEISSGPRWASTADWSNSPQDQFGRQGSKNEIRGVRRYGNEAGEDEAQRQAGEDYEAMTDESAGASGMDRALSMLRQTDVDFKEAEEGDMGPPEGAYFDAWKARGYSDIPAASAELLRSQLRGPDQIESFLARFVGRRDLDQVRRLTNTLRMAKNPAARTITSEDINQVKKQLRPLLAELF